MKNFKFLSALALTGMLSTSIIGTTLATTTDNYASKNLGIRKQLVAGETVVPFILDNRNDIITKSDMEGLTANEPIKTGDTIIVNGTEAKAVVYGDVTRDGAVDVNDVQKAAEANAKARRGENILDKFQFAAADVKGNDNKVNIVDVQALAEFSAKRYGTNVNYVDEPADEEAVESNFTVTVAGEHPYVNNQNEKDVNIQIALSEQLSKIETFTLELKGYKKTDGSSLTKTVDVKIPANTSKVTVASLADTEKDIIAWESNGKIDLKTTNEWANGEIKGTLKKKNQNEVVNEFTIYKYSTTPTVANVRADRLSTYNYKFSLDTSSEYPISAVYYYRQEFSDGTTTAGEATSPADEVANMFQKATKLNCSNGSVAQEIEDKTMKDGFASTLYYVLEDIYGNRTINTVPSTVITGDANAKKLEKPVVLKPSSLASSTATFTWTQKDSTNQTYTATLYYKETADATPVIVDGVNNVAHNVMYKDFSSKMNKAGFYYVEVFSNSTGDTLASEVGKSEEVEIKKLPSILNPHYNAENTQDMLVWDKYNSEEITNAISKIEVTIKRKDGEPISNSESCTVSNYTDISATINNLKPGIIYIAEIKVTAKTTQREYVSSDIVESAAFFTLGDTTSVDTVGSNTITLSNVPKVNDTSATYAVNVVEIIDGVSGGSREKEPFTISNLKIDDNGNLVIPGLEAGHKYRIQLKCILSDGTEAVSGYIPSTATQSIRTFPKISGVYSNETSETGIYATSTSIKIDNVTYNSSDYTESSTLFTKIATSLSNLKEGDKVTVDLDQKTFNVEFNESTQSIAARNLGDLQGFSVELSSKNTRRGVTITSAKDLVLNSGLYGLTVSGLESDYITCKDGADITNSANNNLKVLSNATVTMDGVVVKPSVDSVMKYTKGTTTLDINITPVENNITISNNNTRAALTVNFVNTARPADKQMGSVTIVNGGNVTVKTSQGGEVNSSINITVTDGNVDLTDGTNKNVSGGDKDITVNTSSASERTITGYAKTKLPDSILNDFNVNNGKTINLSKKFNLNDPSTLTNITNIMSWHVGTNDEKIKALVEYLQNNFANLIGRNASIIIDQKSNHQGFAKITIKITEDTSKSSPIVINGLR